MSDEKQKEVFARNLNKYLERSGKTQKEVAQAIGVIPTTFNTWCLAQALPRMGKVQLLADYFGINKSDLIENQSEQREVHASCKAVTIPVLGRVAAGIPINAITEIIDTEEISEDMAKTGDFFALQIKGDSMEPRIYDGDVVIVRQQEDADSGDIVIAMVNGYDATCKRLVKYATSIALVSLNSKYEPMMFTMEEVESKPVRIIGKVVELRGKF